MHTGSVKMDTSIMHMCIEEEKGKREKEREMIINYNFTIIIV